MDYDDAAAWLCEYYPTRAKAGFSFEYNVNLSFLNEMDFELDEDVADGCIEEMLRYTINSEFFDFAVPIGVAIKNIETLVWEKMRLEIKGAVIFTGFLLSNQHNVIKQVDSILGALEKNGKYNIESDCIVSRIMRKGKGAFIIVVIVMERENG